MFEEAERALSLIRRVASKSSVQGLAVLFLFIPEIDYCCNLLLQKSTGPDVGLSEVLEEHQSPSWCWPKCLRATSKRCRVAPFLSEKEYQAQLWYFLPLLKKFTFFGIWKKEVYQQPLKFKRCQCAFTSQSFPRNACVSRQNQGTMVRLYDVAFTHLILQLIKHDGPPWTSTSP